MFEKTGKYHLLHAKAKVNLNQAKHHLSNDCYKKISKCQGIKTVNKLTQITANRCPLLKPVKPLHALLHGLFADAQTNGDGSHKGHLG